MSLYMWCSLLGTAAVLALAALMGRILKIAAKPNSWAARYLAKLEPQKWPSRAIIFILIFFLVLIVGQFVLIHFLFKP
jgi:hypothetical protein